MKKVCLTVAAAVLMSALSFAQDGAKQATDKKDAPAKEAPKKDEKKSEKKDAKKAEKKDEKKAEKKDEKKADAPK